MAQGIGEYADKKHDDAVAQAKVDAANGDTAAFAADKATAEQWMEGGDSRAELQALGGALIGGLGRRRPIAPAAPKSNPVDSAVEKLPAFIQWR